MDCKNIENCLFPSQPCSSRPLLTNYHHLSMTYAFWKNNMLNEKSVYEIIFRKCPFGGEFTIYAGLEDCLHYLKNLKFSENDIEYLKKILPRDTETEFFHYLATLDAKDIKILSVAEGTVVFPRVPLMRIEGPMIIVQLLETPFLNFINFASLVATNAARYRLAAGRNKELVEIGIRMAQGPNGAVSASKFAYIGGFDSTSNMLAAKLYGIPLRGCLTHTFILAHTCLVSCKGKCYILNQDGYPVDFVDVALAHRSAVATLLNLHIHETDDSELASFIDCALAVPENFLCLIDTYDVIKSGLLNFCGVALTLKEMGHRALGVRIGSGDLAVLSILIRNAFRSVSQEYRIHWFSSLLIDASNVTNEDTILGLNEQGHEIDTFYIGTQLVTCYKQSTLNCVMKLIEIDGKHRLKTSEDLMKVTMPGSKIIYRLFGREKFALLDLMQLSDEVPPSPGRRVLCRHPFHESKRVYIIPQRVVKLHHLCWSNNEAQTSFPTLPEIKKNADNSMASLMKCTKRYLSPKPYKISVSEKLYRLFHHLWLKNTPINELE